MGKQNSSMRGLVLLTVFALAAVASGIDLFDCNHTRDHLKWHVCCSLLTDMPSEDVAVQAQGGDMCRCAIDAADMQHMKITYRCSCLGVELASCTGDIMEVLAGKFEVCCDFGIGDE